MADTVVVVLVHYFSLVAAPTWYSAYADMVGRPCRATVPTAGIQFRASLPSILPTDP